MHYLKIMNPAGEIVPPHRKASSSVSSTWNRRSRLINQPICAFTGRLTNNVIDISSPMSNVPRRRYFTSFSQHGITQWELVQNSILCCFQYIVSGPAYGSLYGFSRFSSFLLTCLPYKSRRTHFPKESNYPSLTVVCLPGLLTTLQSFSYTAGYLTHVCIVLHFEFYHLRYLQPNHSIFSSFLDQFHKVHAHAHAQNLRTVLLHRRDYAGSTSYSATEIEELEQGSVTFWERLSAQVAQFLEIFIERERIPKLTRKLSSSRETACSFTATSVKENRRGNGGIAILAWSAGCSTVLSFLGGTQNPLISKELYQLLQQYVGNCILYGQRSISFFKARLTNPKDPTYLCFGYPLPSDNRNYIPWDDPTVSTDELPQLVAEWVSSYYDHPCYDPVTRSLPSTATMNELDGIRLKSDRISISSWTDEELVKGLERSSAKNETLVLVGSLLNSDYLSLFLSDFNLQCKRPFVSCRNKHFSTKLVWVIGSQV